MAKPFASPLEAVNTPSQIPDKIHLRILVTVEDHRIEDLVHWQLVARIILRRAATIFEERFSLQNRIFDSEQSCRWMKQLNFGSPMCSTTTSG
jgi:hypothetical protein